MGLNDSVDRFTDALLATGKFARKGIVRRFTVSIPKPSGKGKAVVGVIDGGAASLSGQVLNVGAEREFAAGDVYPLYGTGDPNDPQWRLGEREVSRNPSTGANLYAALPAPVMSAVVNPDDSFSNPISLGTEADLNATTGANGEPMAVIHAIYRTIVPGSYSVYKDYLQKVQLQVKATSATGWRNIPTQHITPARPIRITLNEALDASETGVDITLPADVSLDELIPGFYCHWRIDGEIVIGKVVSTVLLTILASGGRGVDGTTAASHTSGAQIELLSGVATVTGMDPGVSTSARIAFVDGHDVAGPPSVTNVLTTWKRVSIPALTGAQYSVEMRSNGFHLEWERPTDPVSGLPITARLLYRIYRNTSATTSGAKTVAEGISGFSADIPATLWDVDATRASAYWFGIEPYDSFGNAGTLLWEKDDVPPPHPYHGSVSIYPDVDQIRVFYDAVYDTNNSRLDRGFDSFVLYRAESTSGTNAVEVRRFQSDSGEYTPPLDKAYYYQLGAVDFAGNPSYVIGAGTYDSDLYWRAGIPESLSQEGLINGAFQTPDTGNRTVTDGVYGSPTALNIVNSASANFTIADVGRLIRVNGASADYAASDAYGVILTVNSPTQVVLDRALNSGTTGSGKTVHIGENPKYYRYYTSQLYGGTGAFDVKKLEYLTAGGTRGNRVIRLTISPLPATSRMMLVPTFAIPWNPLKTSITFKWWMKCPTNVTIVDNSFLIRYADDQFFTTGTGTVGSGADTTPAPDGAWHEYSVTYSGATLFGAAVTARVILPMLQIELDNNNAGDVDVDIDDISMSIS